MTEKRFYYAHGVVWDTKKPNGLNGISINDLYKGLRVANWLNELNDENERLKENCKNYNWYKQYKTLLNENEQLKHRIEELQNELNNCEEDYILEEYL